MTASVCGRDGVGVVLGGPDGPIRWLLLEGFTYYVDDQDEPGQWLVREASPHTGHVWTTDDLHQAP